MMARYSWFGLLVATAVGSSAMALAVTTADADTKFFGQTTQQRAVTPAAPKKKGLFWFLFERPRKKNASVIYGDSLGNETNPKYGDVDPEPLPSIGMGNLTYEPLQEVPLYDAAFQKLSAPTPEGELIRQSLSDRNSPVAATVHNRKAILAFYRDRQFAPVWISNGKLSDRAFAILATMAHAGENGLDPARYLPTGVASYETATSDTADLDTPALMRLDISITALALLYAEHVSRGRFVPERLSQYYDINSPAPDAPFMLKILASTPFPEEYFSSLEPRHPAYAMFKKALAEIDSKPAGEQRARFPSGPVVKLGQRDPRVPELRQRLVDAGLLDPEFMIIEEENLALLDKPLASAIKALQSQNKLKPTGLLDGNIVKLLNADPTVDHRNKLIVNMERARWLPTALGDRYVFVNQAGFWAEVIDSGQQVWKTKVIIGKPLTQTPAFHDEFETVVFNPSWGMPQSILVNEYLGKLRRDPGYFDKIGYKVTNSSGQSVSSYDVDWFSVGANSGVGVQQPPGKDNALGELKFLFPNKHDVYMHDTPTRKLFAQTVRTFSHGCVRVENPREFAHVLLGWNPDEIAANIESGESSSVRIPRKTNVHITYFTAWPGANGNMEFYPDVYERDKTMLEAIDAAEAPQKGSTAGGIADATLISGSIGNP